ncbi:cyclodeaminase [Defluviimonas salinarum]|uniref:Cyclodeaminase n=1 Tax=Defluviimonas salinarum TaxID=2992147 RepID=A0ABT3J7F9_9RHOB|nr:cyclodeaminase [Defluviimonas salinarum]MCW3783617.1 cyclodeaminase [Defluviimonas salinarum]
MNDILILNETELRRAAPLNLEAIDTVESCFRALAGPGVVMPPILSMEMKEANGEVDVKTAYLPGMDSFAIKISPGFFDNPKIGLPSLSGMMVVLSARTGLVEALLLDNGYLTNVRTAAAGAVAARHLAPTVVETAGVIGAGVQARLQMIAAHLVRPFRHALVWSPDDALNQEAAAEITAATGALVRVAESAEEVVRQSHLVVTTTPARTPVLMADWLHPGLHITCMGSDQHGKNEIDPKAIAAADLYVCDRVSQCVALGELRSARAAGFLTDVTPPELGQIVTGAVAGRPSSEAITICDLTGTGAQDTAIANFARRRAVAVGAGAAFAR